MQTLLIYVVALLLVGGLLFLAASFAFGRDEEMAPVLPEGTPVELPDDRPASGADLRALRLSVVLRGYRMEEVDWVLDRLAEQVDSRDREIARLHSVLHVEPVPVGAVPPGSGGSGEPAGSGGASRYGGSAGSGVAAGGPQPADRDDPEPELLTHGAESVRAESVRAEPDTLRAGDDAAGRREADATDAGRGPEAARSAEQRLRGPAHPVRGLRPDGVPDREQR